MSMIKRLSCGGVESATHRQIETKPFPRYPALANLTWDRCFEMNGDEILEFFVRPLCGNTDVTRLAYMLSFMMQQPASAAGSTAVLTTLLRDAKLPTGRKIDMMRWPRIDPIDARTGCKLPLGCVHWRPTGGAGAGLDLLAFTICDILGACMSEAAYLSPSHAEFKIRTKINFYARLIALYSHWCVRLTGEDRRPARVGMAVFKDAIILGSSIPDVPEMKEAKVFIRRARFYDLKRRGRHEGGKLQMLDIKKVEKMLPRDFGNCSETWTFVLLCIVPEAMLPKVFGISVNVPTMGQSCSKYNEEFERSKDRYAPLCVHCEKLYKEIATWGRPGEKMMENFSVSKWEGPQ